eukprot:scaffold54134_cov23-Prasinocladus_malaysianus.AAC.1
MLLEMCRRPGPDERRSSPLRRWRIRETKVRACRTPPIALEQAPDPIPSFPARNARGFHSPLQRPTA